MDIPPITECPRLADDELQALIVPILRRYTPTLFKGPALDHGEGEILFGLWRRCWEEGMHELLTIVALQILFQDREILNLETFAAAVSAERLLSPPIFQPHSMAYWRLYFELLRVVLWTRRRLMRGHRSPSSPITTAKGYSGDAVDCLQQTVVRWLLSHAKEILPNGKDTGGARKKQIVRLIVTFIHQLYLESPTLITVTEPYDMRLIPWMVEFAPSTHVLMERLPEKLQSLPSVDPFLMKLAALLAIKYPIPASLSFCELLIQRFQGLECDQVSDAIQCLDIAVLAMTAFPSLMTKVAPLLVKWTSQWAQEESFKIASQAAIASITAITSAVNSPIYQRPPLLEYP